MMTQEGVLYAWAKRGSSAHFAAGKGHNTACGFDRRGWSTGAAIPEGRRLCRRCDASQRDASKTGGDD